MIEGIKTAAGLIWTYITALFENPGAGIIFILIILFGILIAKQK